MGQRGKQALLLRKLDGLVGDDVLLHLGGAGADGQRINRLRSGARSESGPMSSPNGEPTAGRFSGLLLLSGHVETLLGVLDPAK
jgi:hypothetical protein